MDFRTNIMQFVFERIYDELVVKDPNGTMIGNRLPPDPVRKDKPDPDDNNVPTRDPNPGYNTPLWQVRMRPPQPEDVRQTSLQPSAFIQVLSGERSRSGRGIQDSPIRSVVGDISESYTIGITGIFSQNEGPKSAYDPNLWEAYVFNANTKPKTLTEQVNGWIWDLDQILNVNTLRPPTASAGATQAILPQQLATDLDNAINSPTAAVPLSADLTSRLASVFRQVQNGGGATSGITLPTGATIAEAYLQNWETRKGFKGSPTEIVLSELVVTINYTRI